MATTNTRIVIRRDSSTNWSRVNPELLAGEQGFETDTGRLKIGTGALWNATPYMVAGATGMLTFDSTDGNVGLTEASVKGLFSAEAPLTYTDGVIGGDVYSKAEVDTAIGTGATGAFVAAEEAMAAARAAQSTVDATISGATGTFLYIGDVYSKAEVDSAIGMGATGAFVAAEEAMAAAKAAQLGVDGLVASGATGALAAAEAAQLGVDNILTGATGGGFVGTFQGPLTGNADTSNLADEASAAKSGSALETAINNKAPNDVGTGYNYISNNNNVNAALAELDNELTTRIDDGPNTDVQFRNVVAVGSFTGKIKGDVYASDGTTVLLDHTAGTFTGDVTGGIVGVTNVDTANFNDPNIPTVQELLAAINALADQIKVTP